MTHSLWFKKKRKVRNYAPRWSCEWIRPYLSQQHSIRVAKLVWTATQKRATKKQKKKVKVNILQIKYRRKFIVIRTWSVRSSAITSSKPASLSIWDQWKCTSFVVRIKNKPECTMRLLFHICNKPARTLQHHGDHTLFG